MNTKTAENLDLGDRFDSRIASIAAGAEQTFVVVGKRSSPAGEPASVLLELFAEGRGELTSIAPNRSTEFDVYEDPARIVRAYNGAVLWAGLADSGPEAVAEWFGDEGIVGDDRTVYVSSEAFEKLAGGDSVARIELETAPAPGETVAVRSIEAI